VAECAAIAVARGRHQDIRSAPPSHGPASAEPAAGDRR
jgi:hypothetical protein